MFLLILLLLFQNIDYLILCRLQNYLYSKRSTLVVFGVCNCPSSSDEDLKTLFFDFLSGSKVSLPPTVILKHCFAFDVTDVQLQTLSSISSSQSQNFSIFVSDRESTRDAPNQKCLELDLRRPTSWIVVLA